LATNYDVVKKTLDAAKANKKVKASQLVNSNPEQAALISKLIRPVIDKGISIRDKNTRLPSLNRSELENISEATKARVRDNEAIIQLFPDIELAILIIVSSILSPKDMISYELTYKTTEEVFTNDLNMKLIDIVKDHFTNYYNLEDNLHEILRDSLFTTGSYISAILPESAIDEIINNNVTLSRESISSVIDKNDNPVCLGILGPRERSNGLKPGLSLENYLRKEYNTQYELFPVITEKLNGVSRVVYSLEDLVQVTDNPQFLKMPQVLEANRKSKIKSIFGAQKEKKLTPDELAQLVYKKPRHDPENTILMPTSNNTKRKSIGRPLILKLPSESVIPVFVPGDPTHHIGYFVLIDGDGNPVTLDTDMKYIGDPTMQFNLGTNEALSSVLINRAKQNLLASDYNPQISELTTIYADIIENDLMERLANGIYGSNVQLSRNEDIYRIMLARALANKFTRLIYIPMELVTYFAFKFHSNGVGKSLLDDIKILTSLRAILLFAKTMAEVKQSISLTRVDITLDEHDPDPEKTIEVAQDQISKIRQQYFPLGINSPVDLVDWLQRAGLFFTFQGHPDIPNTRFEWNPEKFDVTEPNSDLMDDLKKQTFEHFGLPPEVVDNGFSPDFATTITNNNILMSKRILMWQKIFCTDLSDYARKIVKQDGIFLTDLRDALINNKGLLEESLTDEDKEAYKLDEQKFYDDILERFIEMLEVELPKPNATSLANKLEAFNNYTDSLDKALESWVNTDIFSAESIGDFSGYIDAIRNVIRSYYLRSWMSENGFMSELADLIAKDEDGKPLCNIYEINAEHAKNMLQSFFKYYKALQATKVAANLDVKKLDLEGGDSVSSSSDSGSSDSGSGSDEGGFGGEMGDMGMDLDMGGDFDMGGGEEGGAEEGGGEETETDTETTEASES
jgi:hypothetical protein